MGIWRHEPGAARNARDRHLAPSRIHRWRPRASPQSAPLETPSRRVRRRDAVPIRVRGEDRRTDPAWHAAGVREAGRCARVRAAEPERQERELLISGNAGGIREIAHVARRTARPIATVRINVEVEELAEVSELLWAPSLGSASA